MLVMVNANVDHLKKRDTTRQMLEFSIKGIAALEQER